MLNRWAIHELSAENQMGTNSSIKILAQLLLILGLPLAHKTSLYCSLSQRIIFCNRLLVAQGNCKVENGSAPNKSNLFIFLP